MGKGAFLRATYPPDQTITAFLAGRIKDFAVDLTKDNVEEAGDDMCSTLSAQKIIALDDIVCVQQNGCWDDALVHDLPLFSRKDGSNGQRD